MQINQSLIQAFDFINSMISPISIIKNASKSQIQIFYLALLGVQLHAELEPGLALLVDGRLQPAATFRPQLSIESQKYQDMSIPIPEISRLLNIEKSCDLYSSEILFISIFHYFRILSPLKFYIKVVMRQDNHTMCRDL